MKFNKVNADKKNQKGKSQSSKKMKMFKEDDDFVKIKEKINQSSDSFSLRDNNQNYDSDKGIEL